MPATCSKKKGKQGAQDVESLLEKRIGIVTGKRDSENMEADSSSSDSESQGGDSSSDHCKIPSKKAPAQVQPLLHSLSSTGMTTSVIDSVAMITGTSAKKLSATTHEEVTMQTDIELTKNLFIRDRPCTTDPKDTSYEMYDKIRSAVKHTLFQKVKFYRDINDADVFVGWGMHRCGYNSNTMHAKWQCARYWNAVRDIIMKLTKDKVQVCVNNFYKAVNG